MFGATEGLEICKVLYIKPFITFVNQYTKNEEIILLLQKCYAVLVELIVKWNVKGPFTRQIGSQNYFDWNQNGGDGYLVLMYSWTVYFLFQEIFITLVESKNHYSYWSPFGRRPSFVCLNFNPLHPRTFCVRFGWHWPRGFIFNSLLKDMALHRTDLNRFLCKVWLKLVMRFWRRRFLNVRSLRRWIRRQTTNISYLTSLN